MLGFGLGINYLRQNLPAGSAPTLFTYNYFTDGASVPLTTPPSSFANFIDTSTGTKGTLWMFWQGARLPYDPLSSGSVQRYAECATLNLDTGKFLGPFICGYQSTTLSGADDVHGVPTAMMDASGYVYCFYGPILSASHVASTVNARDPSCWRQLADLSVPSCFVQPRLVGSTIWATFTGLNTEDANSYISMASSVAGVPTWNSPVNYLDYTLDSGDWNFPSAAQVYGTKIYLATAHANSGAGFIRDIYFLSIDTTNGNVSNFDGTTVVAIGSQPIRLATMNSFFRVLNNFGLSNNNGVPAMWYDGVNNIAHIAYGQNNTGGGAYTIQYINLSISGGVVVVSSPVLLFTYATATPRSPRLAVIPVAGGGIKVIFPDGTFSGATTTANGNVLSLNRSSGGVWDVSPTTVKTAGSVGLDVVAPVSSIGNVVSPVADVLYSIAEAANGEATLTGTNKGYLIGNRPAIITTYSGIAQNMFDRWAAAGSAPPNQTWRDAVDAFARTSGVVEFIGLSDIFLMMDTWDSTSANLNWADTRYGLTAHGSPTFTAKLGFTTDGSTSYLDTGFNAASSPLPKAIAGFSSVGAEFQNVGTGKGAGSYESGVSGLNMQMDTTPRMVSRIGGIFNIQATSASYGFGFASQEFGTDANNLFNQFNDTAFGSVTADNSALPNASVIIGGIGTSNLFACQTSFFQCGFCVYFPLAAQLRVARKAWVAGIASA